MADHTLYDATTHPIVRLEDDWNNMEREAHEKIASYIMRVNGTYFETILGGGTVGAGTIVYGGAGNAGATSGLDAGAVLQATINAAEAAGGGLILLKQGTYTINDGVVIDSANVYLVGEDQASTIIYLADGSSIDALEPMLFVKQNGTIKFAVKNLTFDGNRDNNANGKGIVVGRDFSDATSDVLDIRVIEDVLVRNCAESGVCIGGIVDGHNYGACENPMLHRVTAWRNAGHGFIILASDGTLESCYAGQNGYSGFHIKGTAYMFSNCKAYGNNYDPATGGDGGHAGEAGFYLYDSDVWGNMFVNCQSDTNFGFGFLLYTSVEYNTFVGCQAWDNSVDDATPAYSGFKLDTGCVGNKFIACVSCIMREGNFQKAGWEFSGAGCVDNALVGCQAGPTYVAGLYRGTNIDDSITWGGGALWYENTVTNMNEGYYTNFVNQPLWISTDLSTTSALEVKVDADTVGRIMVRPDSILFGSGAAAVDCDFYRSLANQLSTSDQIVCADGIVTKTKAGVLADGDFTVPTTGLLAVDTANSDIYFRTGAATWHYCHATAGFVVPKEEVNCPVCGELIEKDQFVCGQINQIRGDNSRHGLYVHLKCALNH